MVNELKRQVIEEVENLVFHASLGHTFNVAPIVDKIWYVKYL